MSFAIAASPSLGTATLSGDRVDYMPATDANGSDNFTFAVSDGENISEPATVSVTINNVNDAPKVGDVTATTSENTPVIVELPAQDNDGDVLSFLVLLSEDGTTAVSDNELSFTPDPGFGGTASITYRATDGGRSFSNTGAVSIAVTDGTNDVPVAEDDSVTVNEGHDVTVTLSATDPETTALTYTLAGAPAHGSVSIADNKASYTPDAQYYGADSFTFTASDGVNTSDPATITVTVNAVADPVVDCDAEVDPSHIQSDTDATTGRTVKYFDNLIGVVMDRVATPDELAEMRATAGATATVCSIEQAPLTADEAGDSGLTGSAGYAVYTFEVAEQATLADLATIADSLESLSYVVTASYEAFDSLDIDAAETDTELYGYTHHLPIEPTYFKWIQLKGMLDYISVFGNLSSVNAAIADTGVCADTSDSWECIADMGGITDEFSGFIRQGANVIGKLSAKTASGSPQPAYPLGLVDIHRFSYHGTSTASLMAAASNGNAGSPDMWSTSLVNPPYSSIMGSVSGLDYILTSYLIVALDDYQWDTLFLNTIINTLIAMCGDAVTNHSYGVRDPTIMTDNDVRSRKFWNSRDAGTMMSCPQTLYVYSAGNDQIDFSADSDLANIVLGRGMSPSGDFLDNVIEVGAAEYDSYEPSTVSNYGNGIDVVSSGYYTSYAAPIVAGVAGVLKGINPALSATRIKEILTQSGRPNGAGTPFLDAAAAALLAIKETDENYSPMASTSLSFTHEADLAKLRGDEGYSAGKHAETGLWIVDGKELTVTRMATEESSAAPDPADAGGDSSSTAYEWVMQAQTTAIQTYETGLSESSDRAFPDRRVPIQVILPKGRQSHTISGKYNAHHHESPAEVDLEPLQEDVSQAYCFAVTYDLNTDAAAKDGKGFHVPLARESESLAHTVPFKISGATLAGNFTRKVSDYWDNELYNYYWFGNEELITTSPEADPTGYDEMAIPSCDENITDEHDDNGSGFYAWVAAVEGTTKGTGSYTISCGGDGAHHFAGQACGEGQYVPADCTCEEQLYRCNVNDLWSRSPVSPADVAVYWHLDVALSDIECSLSMSSINADLNLTGDDDVAIGEDFLQTFKYEADDAGSTLCTATANYTLTSVYEREYESTDGLYEFNNFCPLESMLRTGKWEDSLSADVTWDFSQGDFPLPSVFDRLEEQWPTLLATYQTWLKDYDGDGDFSDDEEEYYLSKDTIMDLKRRRRKSATHLSWILSVRSSGNQ